MAKDRRWCQPCHRHVLAENDPPDQSALTGMGCLTLLTCGLALPFVVAFLLYKNAVYRCPACGGSTSLPR
jgi:hypothetical protein